MPITPHVRERVIASEPACLLVAAAAAQGAEYAEALLRAPRLAWHTTDLLLDDDRALAAVCASVAGRMVLRRSRTARRGRAGGI